MFTAVKEDTGKNSVHVCFGNAEHMRTLGKVRKAGVVFDEAAVENRAPVVVYGHKSPYMPVCFLACVRSGRAYCPVDVSMPEERIRDIAAETGSPLILATRADAV